MPTNIPGKESRVYRQPIGVVGMISPRNFPLHLSSRSVAPALALGNSVVIKPSSDTPVIGGTLRLSSGRLIPVLGQGTWEMGEERFKRQDEIAALRTE